MSQTAPSFVVTVRFKVIADQVEPFRVAMLEQAKNSLELEPECTHFDVCFNPEDSSEVFLYELYCSEAAFKLHLASDHFIQFNELVTPWTLEKEVRTWTLG